MCHFSCWLVRTADLMIHYISPHASTCSIRSALCAFLLGDFSTLENAIKFDIYLPSAWEAKTPERFMFVRLVFTRLCFFCSKREKKSIIRFPWLAALMFCCRLCYLLLFPCHACSVQILGQIKACTLHIALIGDPNKCCWLHFTDENASHKRNFSVNAQVESGHIIIVCITN